MNNKTIKLLTVLTVLMTTVGCFQMKESYPNEGAPQSSVGGPPMDPNTGDPITPGALTLKVSGQGHMLYSLQNILKVTTLSAVSIQKGNPTNGTKSASLTLEGVPKTLNAPAVMATVEIASEVCNDLVTQEAALADANRRFLNGINLTAGTAQLSAAIVDGLVSKFTRAAWARVPATEEKQALVDGMASFLGGNTAANTRSAILYVCTSVLSSIEGYRL